MGTQLTFPVVFCLFPFPAATSDSFCSIRPVHSGLRGGSAAPARVRARVSATRLAGSETRGRHLLPAATALTARRARAGKSWAARAGSRNLALEFTAEG